MGITNNNMFGFITEKKLREIIRDEITEVKGVGYEFRGFLGGLTKGKLIVTDHNAQKRIDSIMKHLKLEKVTTPEYTRLVKKK